MERVIANDETVVGEGAQEHGLFAWDNAECFLDRFDACDQVRVRAGAANAREELRNGGDWFAFHGVRVESLEFLDGEFHFLHLSIFDKHIEAGGTFHLGELFD